MVKKKLTDKQAAFCREYLIDLNATQAAIRAGYSEKTAYSTGHENLRKPEIQEEIDILRQERNESLKIDAAWVLQKSVELYNRSMEAEPILDKNGEPQRYKFAPAGAGKALELIGKHVDIKAFEKEVVANNNNYVIGSEPVCKDAKEWLDKCKK